MFAPHICNWLDAWFSVCFQHNNLAVGQRMFTQNTLTLVGKKNEIWIANKTMAEELNAATVNMNLQPVTHSPLNWNDVPTFGKKPEY